MIENLIQVYRKEFYDWSLGDWYKIMKKNKKFFWNIGTLFLLVIIAYIVSLYTGKIIWTVIGMVPIFVMCIHIDRIVVQTSRLYLADKHEHLNHVKEFLENLIKGETLFTEHRINILIERLSKRINSKNPFYNIWGKTMGFIRTSVVPVATFFAGIYSQRLREFDPLTLFGAALMLMMICGILSLIWMLFASFIRNTLFRDVDAAISLKEDLLDLQLIYFGDSRRCDEEV